jgi:co-chaperonin GroES (HSP10)
MINPKKGILLIRKHKQTAYKNDIAIVDENDEDKRLITGEVLLDSENYKKGDTVIFGKYALYQLTIQGVDYYLLQEDDVIGLTDYKEI